jgi:dTDP-glucose pyrophosphorylase
MKEKISQLFIDSGKDILFAMNLMDSLKRKLLIVTEANLFRSLLSIGDVQRAILNNTPLDIPVHNILRPSVKVASVNDHIEDIRAHMLERRNEFMPIINDFNQIVDVIFWEDLLTKKERERKVDLKLPVIIMAGGKGARLKPLTNILPKPLIPIGEQTILEDIMDRFVDCGCNEFYISLNYKAEFIKQYLNNLDKPQYEISYFQEEKPLGTAGSLHLLKDKIKTTFFVSNCDIIVDEDYINILDYHRTNQNEITIIAAIKNYSIPYGTLETGKNGLLKAIKEKPEYIFKINTGMYLLEPKLLEEIPLNKFYHITTLIQKLIEEGRKVGVFPISEGSWTDIGNWDEYIKYLKD